MVDRDAGCGLIGTWVDPNPYGTSVQHEREFIKILFPQNIKR